MTHFIERLPRQHKIGIALLLGALLVLALLPSEQASASRNTPDVDQLELGKRYQLDLKIQPPVVAENEAEAIGELEWESYEVRSGDSMARIFQRVGFSAQELYRVTQAEDADKLRRIHPGNTLRFGRDEEGQLAQIAFEVDPLETLLITRNDDGTFYSELDVKEVEVRLAFANATISSSFWNAGVQAGLTQGQIMSLAELFGWDVDFVLDIRPGDHFSVLYEERFIDGSYVGSGRIVAAEFNNQGDSFQAVRHDNGNYYTPEGRSMRQAFLRAPVSFNRVSSEFNPRRTHPVTGRVRPHNGIDYAAATGTPVMAAGDGRVVRSGYNNLNGNYVFVQHGERYTTKYLHLNSRKVKQGARVKQGQTIGTVGATGRVTGPHLHYEFLVDGIHRNPRTVDLPTAESLPSSEMPAFTAVAEQYLAKLESQRRVMLALND
ncbi:peptidoglycan DD-metalloendopeptidase family protein [Aliidiomarina sp. Khilg15.8]